LLVTKLPHKPSTGQSTHTKSYSKLLICLLQSKRDVHQWSKLNVINTLYVIHSAHVSIMQRISQF